MRTALLLNAPYGMVFQQVQSILNPAQIDLYLVHDTEDTAVVIAWLEKVKESYIDEQTRQRTALAAANIASMALAEQLAQQSKIEMEKTYGGPDAPPPKPVVQFGTHDWQGAYKLGAICAKCEMKATGFEPACTK